MGRSFEAVGQHGAGVAAGAVDLHLRQVKRAVKVGSAEVGVAQVNPENVAPPHSRA
jgi:hypothetical protein